MEFANGRTRIVGGADVRDQIVNGGTGGLGTIEGVVRLLRYVGQCVEAVGHGVGLHAGRRWLTGRYLAFQTLVPRRCRAEHHRRGVVDHRPLK